MAKKKQTKVKVFRNPLYNHPLLKKGCLHQKSNKAKRRETKVDDLKNIKEY